MTTIDDLVKDIMKVPYSKFYARERIAEAKAEWGDAARFEAMVRVLLSSSASGLVITRSALEESVDDYRIVTLPDSRLSGVLYCIERINKPNMAKETK